MASYNHTQASAAAIWLITHNLNEPIVAVDVNIYYNGNLEKILPKSIKHASDNSIEIEFSEAQTGKARIVSVDKL